MKREETVDHHVALPGTASQGITTNRLQNSADHVNRICLAYHSCDDGTPATKIAPQMGLEPRSLTRLLKSMEDKKLIIRKADKNDRRSVRIFLTKTENQEKTQKILLSDSM